MSQQVDYRLYELGDLTLESGAVLREARLAYSTHGRLNAAADNCIVFPTYYTGTHTSNARVLGPGRALDPERWFIVVPNLFGNGLSSSPSNAAAGQRGALFPHTTVLDNVLAQHRLVVGEFGVQRIALVTGWSVGALQAWQWAIAWPELVERLLPVCGAARCWPQNYVFLEGVRAALCADPELHRGGDVARPIAGLRAFGRAYAGWAYSAQFWREELWRGLGYESLEAFLVGWEEDHLDWAAQDLLHMLRTWQQAEPRDPRHPQRDFRHLLASVRARTIVMPCDQDRYFTLEENRLEAALVPGAQLRPLVSPFGHCAGAPGRFTRETEFYEQALRELLASV